LTKIRKRLRKMRRKILPSTSSFTISTECQLKNTRPKSVNQFAKEKQWEGV
jgi:hypothetical protein